MKTQSDLRVRVIENGNPGVMNMVTSSSLLDTNSALAKHMKSKIPCHISYDCSVLI